MTSDLASSPAAGYVPVGQKPEAVVHAMKVRMLQTPQSSAARCSTVRCGGTNTTVAELDVCSSHGNTTTRNGKLVLGQIIGNQHLYHNE